MLSTEQKLFRERQAQFANQLATDRSAVDQFESQQIALVARRASLTAQLEFLRKDYEALAALQAKQFATRAAANARQIQVVDMEGRLAETEAAIAEARQRKTQAELTVTEHRTSYFRQISEQTQAAQAEIGRIDQEIIAARDIVAKSAIRSPQDGIVANIRIKAPGSAVVGGQAILDIVPANQPMLIEGRVHAADIDSIHVGQSTEIKLTSFGAAEAKPLIGHIIYIAPDGTADERTGEISYVFRARIDDGELAKQPGLFLYPGMVADMSIINGNRTALAYLTLPIMKSFSKAFREQ